MRITFAHHSTNGGVEGITIEALPVGGIAYNDDYFADNNSTPIEIGAHDLKRLAQKLKDDTNAHKCKFDQK